MKNGSELGHMEIGQDLLQVLAMSRISDTTSRCTENGRLGYVM